MFPHLFAIHVFRRGGGVGPGAVLGEVEAFVDRGLNGGFDLVDLVGDRDSFVDQALAQPFDRIAPSPLVDLFASAVTGVAHAFRVRAGPVGETFDQRWTFAGARPPNGRRAGLVDGDGVVPVHAHAGHTVSSRAFGYDRVAGHRYE